MEISTGKQYNRRAFLTGKLGKAFIVVMSGFTLGTAMVQACKAS